MVKAKGCEILSEFTPSLGSRQILLSDAHLRDPRPISETPKLPFANTLHYIEGLGLGLGLGLKALHGYVLK